LSNFCIILHKHFTIRYDTVCLRALRSSDGQHNLKHGTEMTKIKKTKNKNRVPVAQKRRSGQ